MCVCVCVSYLQAIFEQIFFYYALLMSMLHPRLSKYHPHPPFNSATEAWPKYLFDLLAGFFLCAMEQAVDMCTDIWVFELTLSICMY